MHHNPTKGRFTNRNHACNYSFKKYVCFVWGNSTVVLLVPLGIAQSSKNGDFMQYNNFNSYTDSHRFKGRSSFTGWMTSLENKLTWVWDWHNNWSTALCGATALTHPIHLARCLNTCKTHAHMATNAATGWTSTIELDILLPLEKGSRGRKTAVIQKGSVNFNFGRHQVSVNLLATAFTIDSAA